MSDAEDIFEEVQSLPKSQAWRNARPGESDHYTAQVRGDDWPEALGLFDTWYNDIKIMRLEPGGRVDGSCDTFVAWR